MGKWEKLEGQENPEGVISDDAADKIAKAILKLIRSEDGTSAKKPEPKPAESEPKSKPAESEPKSKPAESEPKSKPVGSKSSGSKSEPKPTESKPEELSVITAYQDKTGRVWLSLPLYKEVTVTPVKAWYNATKGEIAHVFTLGELNALAK